MTATAPNHEAERLALSTLAAECNACLDRLLAVPRAALHVRERGDLDGVRAALRLLCEQAEGRRRELAGGPP